MNPSLLDSSEVRLIAPLLPNGAKADPEAVRNGGTNSDAWERLREELQGVRALGDDWDGQGAEAPSAANVDWASDWVRQMRRYPQAIPPSRAVPGVSSEVYLEWRGASFYLVAEISSPARVEWMLSVPGEQNRHWVTEGSLPYFLSPGR
jgi:hypothetical protein